MQPEDPVRLLEDVAARVDAECIVVPDDDAGLLHDVIVGSSVRRLRRTTTVPVVAGRSARPSLNGRGSLGPPSVVASAQLTAAGSTGLWPPDSTSWE